MSQMCQQQQHLHLRRKIQESSRFIKEDYRSLLRQSLSYHHLLAFAITKGMNNPLGKGLNIHGCNCSIHSRLVISRQFAPEACVGTAPHSYHFAHAHSSYILSLS